MGIQKRNTNLTVKKLIMKWRQRKSKLVTIIHENMVQLREVEGLTGTLRKSSNSKPGPVGDVTHLGRAKRAIPTQETAFVEGTRK